MKPSRKSKPKTNAAEKALKQAIAEETAALQAELRQREAEIARLHGVLSQIGGIVDGVKKAEVVAPRIAPPHRPEPEPEEAPAPTAELAGSDNMGPGRWA